MKNISIQKKLHLLIQESLSTLNLKADSIYLEHPANPEHGDVSTNIAMQLFPLVKAEGIYKNPRELAEGIIAQLNKSTSQTDSFISNISVAGPGFINFTLSSHFFDSELHSILAGKGEVIENVLEDKRIITEFTDPNPFKEFHIGHLYSNTVGESISRLLEAVGGNVRRVCYQGDVGMHVAKSIWGIINLLSEKKSTSEVLAKMQDMNTQSVNETVNFLGKAYATGATAYEDNENDQEEMKQLNKKIFAKDPEIFPIYELGRKWSLEYFETVYQRLGTKFEDYYFESEVGVQGLETVKKYLSEGIFEESQGAIIFPGTKYGLHDRVFINSLGLPTYEAKELGLAPAKFKDWPYDQSIIITGNEIKEYFRVLLKALSLIEPDLANKTKHITHGMVRLPEGKMSSRKGNVLTGEWLIEEAKKAVFVILEKHPSEFSITEKEGIAEKVSVAAIKFALLKNNVGGDISFSFEESVSLEGNSGPYIQYTYARCKSVLRKAEHYMNREIETPTGLKNEELTVLRQLYQFNEVVQRSAKEFAPHYICTYLFDLAQAYNSFYNSLSILNAENDQEKKFRLQLTEATSIILQKGLHLLGINTVEKM